MRDLEDCRYVSCRDGHIKDVSMSRKWEKAGHEPSAGPTVERRLKQQVRKFSSGRNNCGALVVSLPVQLLPYFSYFSREGRDVAFSCTSAVNGEIACFLYLCYERKDVRIVGLCSYLVQKVSVLKRATQMCLRGRSCRSQPAVWAGFSRVGS